MAARIGQIEPRRGREYIACRDLAVGESLFTVRPLAAVLRHEYLQSFCSMCFVSFEHDDSCDMEVCDDCRLFSLCGRCCNVSLTKGGDAEVDDGISAFELHKSCGECKILKEGEMTDTTTRMLRRLYYLHLVGESQHSNRAGEGVEQSIQSDFGAVGGLDGLDKLETHASSKDRETLLRYREYARTVIFSDTPPADNAAARKEERALLDRAVAWIQVWRIEVADLSCFAARRLESDRRRPAGPGGPGLRKLGHTRSLAAVRS
jgi:hypothetical protein